MTKIEQLFRGLRSEGRKALMPFITAGDPDLQFTADLLKGLSASGCSMCEIGIPYSDPIADGPVIQSSYSRALNNHVTLDGIMGTISNAAREVEFPMVTMVSYAIVYRHGLREYVQLAKNSGVSGLIVPDLPIDEAKTLSKICASEDVDLIQLVTPTTPRKRAIEIAERSTGFLYYVSVTGITGERSELPESLADEVYWLKDQIALPICIGFGINSVDHVEMLAPLCDGLIVGSAIVRRVAEASEKPRDEVLSDVVGYVESLVAALESQTAN